jgi:predicted MFS family arabinose efflux permease
VLGELALGLRYIAAHPQLSRLVLGFVVVTMVGFSYATVLPGLSIDVLGSGIAGVGILLGISAVGGLVVSLGVAPLADSPRAPLIQLISSAGIGVGLILTGLSPAFAVAALAMLVLGGATSGFQTLNNALVMRHADPAYYGRVMSITMLAFSGVNLVGLPVGLLADAIGERGALLAMGGVVLLAIVLLEVWAGRRAGAEVQGPESSVQSPRRR